MTLAKVFRTAMAGFLVLGLVWLMPAPVSARSSAERLSRAGTRYGPTMPGGYYVRVAPATLTVSHSQRPRLTVAVENATGQPVDDVLVSFTPSEGTLVTETSHTRGGTVTGTFSTGSGSDSPRTAFVTVTVEDVEVTVFIDIVPAVYGR